MHLLMHARECVCVQRVHVNVCIYLDSCKAHFKSPSKTVMNVDTCGI